MPTEKELVGHLKKKGYLDISKIEVDDAFKNIVKRNMLVRIAKKEEFSREGFKENRKEAERSLTTLFGDIRYMGHELSIYSISASEEENTLIVGFNDDSLNTTVGSVTVRGTEDDFLDIGYNENKVGEYAQRFSNVYFALVEVDGGFGVE